MRNGLFVLIIGLPWLASPSSWGAVNVGDHPPLQFTDVQTHQAVDLQSLAGKIVIVDFWASWCGPCMRAAPHIVAINQKYAALGVQTIGISLDQNQSAMERAIASTGFTWPQYFDGLAWQNKVAQEWGVHGIPQMFILSPEGEVLWRGYPGQIDPALERAMMEHPPQRLDPQTTERADQPLDPVNAASAAASYSAAADADARQLDAEADRMLAGADSLVAAHKYAEAATKLKAITESMAGMDAARKAQQSLDKLRANPAAASAIAAAAREDSASVALKTAQKLHLASRDLQAYTSFKSVVERYPGTDAARAATDAIKAYDSDPAFAKQQAAAAIAERSAQARSALNIAMNYLNAGRTDTAKDQFQNVINRFPSTPEADTARHELANLAG